ncbi:energy-coupling factor transporter transmembrane component T family protein [Shouchella lonarensis]|uniref:Energy-coupling factor transport system permease protein n=1 Tax=Shouchella lonarensis TaxID=1464122 RepID=A0A1G6HDA2_9BACI|nr:energy-coupling factor transporter transmembrane component T [Shouchella lonarensis]SDB92068.1 energy-coupling factor transport system permease protein [Shouchella lonarensis]
MTEYKWEETWLSRINPSLKLIVTMVLLVGVIFVHNPNVLILVVVIALFTLFTFSGHPRLFVLLYCLPFILVFVSASTAMVFFGKGETTWFHMGIVHITEESFYRGIHLGLRALTFATFGLLFALTTKPVYLFYSLMQQLRLPPHFAYGFMASIRMIPMMVTEFQTLRYAYQIRGIAARRGVGGMYDMLRFYSVPLLAQAIRRAQRLSVAMTAKQFFLKQKRTYFYKLHFQREDIIFVGGCILAVVSAIYFSTVEWWIPVHDVRYVGV